MNYKYTCTTDEYFTKLLLCFYNPYKLILEVGRINYIAVVDHLQNQLSVQSSGSMLLDLHNTN